ncbi:DnaB-like helicase C-terminal domain-containing protein [Cellulosilyticum sp. ST5]|uniref:DnaB-like helicase C-terminal domain-containing protein n=1 Tax=Cellulosilyticum sp. ST5 TaxID=3055805 RepID=UPI003977A79F
MDLKEIVQEIKKGLSPSQVRSKIEADLMLQAKNKKYVCWLHNDNPSSPNMSFDEEKADFHCFRCGGHYNLFDHYMSHYNLSFIEATESIINDFNFNYTLSKHEPKKLDVVAHNEPIDTIKDYIHRRKISDNTINYIGVKGDGKNVVFEYRDQFGNHIANKYRPAYKTEKGKPKNWWDGEGKNEKTLFNMDKVNVTERLVICEGEFDCLSLIEAGYKNAVSVPAGAKGDSWIEANYDWLMQFDEITLWFDDDDAGKQGAMIVANRLDNCTRVVYCTIANDINEVLYRFGKEEVLKQLANAKELDVDGVLTASQIEDFNVYEAEKIKTGINVIDKYCLGIVFGSLAITTGYNGSGKSTVINQIFISESISQGYKVFCFSGELTPSNFKYWLYNTIADDEDIEELTNKWLEKYYKLNQFASKNITEWIDDKLYLYNKQDYSAKEILSTMRMLAKRKGVRVFILDNLMKIDIEDGGNELSSQKKFVNELKIFVLQYNAIVHLVAHPRKPQADSKITKFDVAGSGDITNLADYVFAISRTSEEVKQEYQDYLANPPKNKVMIDPRDATITLLKDRPTGTSDKNAVMYFDKKRRRFYNTSADLNKSYGYKKTYAQSEIDDDQLPF